MVAGTLPCKIFWYKDPNQTWSSSSVALEWSREDKQATDLDPGLPHVIKRKAHREFLQKHGIHSISVAEREKGGRNGVKEREGETEREKERESTEY